PLDGVLVCAVVGGRRGGFSGTVSIDQAHRDERVRAAAMRGMEAMRATFEQALGARGEAAPANIRQKAAGLLIAYLGLRVMVRAGFDEAALRCAVDDALAGI
ncbi:hypothetical protein MNBD_ALPHA05-2481, partial [hydrothermal vent metagenome]